MSLSRIVEPLSTSFVAQFRVAGLIVITVMASAAVVRPASPGALDLSFADRGTAGHGDTASQFRESETVVVQPDGKVVTAGWTNTCTIVCDYDFLLLRYNPNGSPDLTWGVNGEVVTDFSRQNEVILAAAVQADGKIVVAGGAPDGQPGPNYFVGFKLVRYMPDGSLDATFGSGGRVYENFDDMGGTPSSMLVQPDGNIVVAGFDLSGGLYIARFNPSGGLDTTFGTNGKLFSSTYGLADISVALGPENKIVIGGRHSGGLRLIRFTASGAPDTSYGSAGVVNSSFPGGSFKPTFAVQPDGKVLVSGVYYNHDKQIPPLRRFNDDGTQDITLVPNHGELLNLDTCKRCTRQVVKLLLAPDGSFYLVGTLSTFGKMAVSRYLSNGTIDPSYGFRGFSMPKESNTTDDPPIFQVRDAALQADGKVLITSQVLGSRLIYTTRVVANVTPPSMRSDFDGDGITDAAVFRPSNRFWYALNSSDNSFSAERYGLNGDELLPGDYNYDLKTDHSVNRPSSNTWYITSSPPSGGGNGGGVFGQTGDIRVPEDYDGDGYTDLAVFRPSTGRWIIRYSTQVAYSLEDTPFNWGLDGDIPVPADYDGDGQADVAVFRPSNGYWYILRSSDGGAEYVPWGLGTDKTVYGDYDGDHKTDVAVFRDGFWYVQRSSDGGISVFNWGLSTDLPVPGDYDGDGIYDVAVFRPSEGEWYIRRSSDLSFTAINWGLNGDQPIPSVFVR